MENFKKIEEVCKKKFNEGSFGILTPIFNPVYPSLKYVFISFLIIRLILYICNISICDMAVHAEFTIGAMAIFLSMIASESFESYYTERAEFMLCLIPTFGFSLFICFSRCRILFEKNVSTVYYLFFILDMLFFLYACTIRFKEIQFNKNPKEYLIKHGLRKEDEVPIEERTKIIYICGCMLNYLNDDEKAILEEPFKKITYVNYNVAKFNFEYKKLYDGLTNEEMNIIKSTLLKIYKLLEDTYDDELNLVKSNVFWEILDFLDNFKEIINTYKKSRANEDLDFLKRLNESAEDFYNVVNAKEQAVRQEELKATIEVLKLKAKGIIKEGQK